LRESRKYLSSTQSRHSPNGFALRQVSFGRFGGSTKPPYDPTPAFRFRQPSNRLHPGFVRGVNPESSGDRQHISRCWTTERAVWIDLQNVRILGSLVRRPLEERPFALEQFVTPGSYPHHLPERRGIPCWADRRSSSNHYAVLDKDGAALLNALAGLDFGQSLLAAGGAAIVLVGSSASRASGPRQ
jgi:hypothetical protein